MNHYSSHFDGAGGGGGHHHHVAGSLMSRNHPMYGWWFYWRFLHQSSSIHHPQCCLVGFRLVGCYNSCTRYTVILPVDWSEVPPTASGLLYLSALCHII
eukprot:scaffold1004_cov120-Skeletonema_dohrnii-CCMP3373.AAC.1